MKTTSDDWSLGFIFAISCCRLKFCVPYNLYYLFISAKCKPSSSQRIHNRECLQVGNL